MLYKGDIQMSYEKLSLSGFVEEMKMVSTGAHPRKFCFVLGAGASKSSGIKSGQELVDIWDRELLERNREGHLAWKKAQGINEENQYEFYSQYYERRFRLPGDGYNYLEKMMAYASPNIGYVMLSYLLSHTDHNVVITTNFDHLIEDAVNYYEHTIPLVIGHESLAHYVTKQINRPMIIKIHRDLLLDPKNRIDEVGKLHDHWKRALDIVFSEYHPVFIGYAGNDKSLMDFLNNNSEKILKQEWRLPYWMLYKTDKMSEDVLHFLNESGGYLISHNGFDKVLYLLGAASGYSVPTREEFLSDAEKRFEQLVDSIDEFTEKSVAGKETDQREEDSEEGTDGSEIGEAVQRVTNQAEQQSLYLKALIFRSSGDYEEAIQIYKELIERNPDNARYHNSLGIALQGMKRYEEAFGEKQKAVELDPENADYHDSLSVTLHEMGKYEEALEETRKAVELEPESARYHDSFGTTLHGMGRYEEALKEKRKAVELEPENARYHDSLGVTLHDMGRYEEALKEKRKAVELEPKNVRYHGSLGDTLEEMGRYEEAFKEKRKAVELEPKNAWYHGSLGITLYNMGRYEESLGEMKKALELEPENAWYHDSLGDTLQEMGRYEEALEEKRKAVELEPENAQYHNPHPKLKYQAANRDVYM